METIKVKFTEDLNWNINDNSYKTGQTIEVTPLVEFVNHYAVYGKSSSLDWIPMKSVEVIRE